MTTLLHGNPRGRLVGLLGNFRKKKKKFIGPGKKKKEKSCGGSHWIERKAGNREIKRKKAKATGGIWDTSMREVGQRKRKPLLLKINKPLKTEPFRRKKKAASSKGRGDQRRELARRRRRNAIPDFKQKGELGREGGRVHHRCDRGGKS